MSEKIYNMVDLETIEKLADIVAAKELGEITIADGEKYITVRVRSACRRCRWQVYLWLLRRQFPLLLRQLRQKHRQFPRSPQASRSRLRW